MSGERINVKSELKESPYFNDYLYGISDVTEKVEEFLEGKKDKDWVLFYQVLLLKENLKNTGYFLYSQNKNTYFLMRNDSDFEIFKRFYLGQRDIDKKPYEKEIGKILSKYKDRLNDEKLADKFKSLLENYFIYKDYNGTDEYIISTVELGEFLKEKKRKGKIGFKQAEFFRYDLGFMNVTKEYPKIKNKYNKLVENGK